MGKWIRTNQGVGALLTAALSMLLLYVQLTPWAHRKLRDGFYLGFFPTFAIALMMVCSIIIIVDSRRKLVPAGLEKITLNTFLVAFAEVVLCWIYFALMLKIGYLIVTPVFLFIGMYLLGLKPWKQVLLIAAIMTILTNIIFFFMGIELPLGLLSGISPL